MDKHSNSKMMIKKTVTAALLTALTFVGTMIIQIPTGTNGYIHIGDCFVILCGYILGPIWGFIAAGVGSALTDVATPYFFWAPGTFIIKGAMALIAVVLTAAVILILRPDGDAPKAPAATPTPAPTVEATPEPTAAP